MANTMDQVISKGAGLAHELKARMDGLTGVFGTLAEQHGEAGALLKRAKDDASKRAELWPTIRAALRAHEQAELRVLYPALREYAGLTSFADRHEREATQLSQTIDQMDALVPRSSQFGDMLDRLIELVNQHVDGEERIIFPKAQELIGGERSDELKLQILPVFKQIERTEAPAQKH